MGKLITRVVLGIAAGVAVYVGFTIWANAGRVAEALARFRWSAAAAACALALGNYAVRFVRWQYYLRVLGLSVPAADSAMVFLAGFALTVTPGKLGEAVKAFLLRESHRIPMARTAPIVIAERMTDLVALLLLAMVGVFTFDVDRRFLVAGGVLVALAIAVVSIEPMSELALSIAGRLPFVRRFAPRLREFHVTTAALLRPGAARRRDRAVVRVVVPRVPGVLDGGRRHGGRRGQPARRHLHLCVDDGRGRAVVPARRSRRHRGRHAGAADPARHRASTAARPRRRPS